MKAVDAKEKVLSSEVFLSGEPFTLQDMRLSTGMKAATVAQALRQLEHRISRHVVGMQGGGKRTWYQRVSSSGDLLRRQWVSPEWQWTGCGPLEWSRGR